MKKVIFYMLCFSFIFFTGCTLGNTPTSKVENFLLNYQMLENDVSTDYRLLSNNNALDESLQKRYQNLIKKQYRNLSYTNLPSYQEWIYFHQILSKGHPEYQTNPPHVLDW